MADGTSSKKKSETPLQRKLRMYSPKPYGEGLPCPELKHHVKGEPEGYLQWHAWAEKKIKTHKQSRCPGCGLYVIWTSKKTGKLA